MQYNNLDRRVDALTGEVRSLAGSLAGSKAAAILAGARRDAGIAEDGNYRGDPFLKALADARRGDPEANAHIKAVLGTSAATGQAIVPNNFVADLSAATATRNVFRQVMSVNTGITGAGVDIPYELTSISRAIVQSAYGSNKEVRDFQFGEATATLYTYAQIADIGNQLLRQSGGAAEAAARRRLAESFGIAESDAIVNGTGSNQPLGILTAILQFGDIAATKYTLNSETRVAALAGGISKLDTRGVTPNAVVMNPTDYWEMLTETLGTSGSGGWAMDPSNGPFSGAPQMDVWGIPIYRCPELPAGTALVADWTAFDIWIGQEFRIDVSTEGGNRFDQNVTGFRAEEEFGFNAEPGVRTLKVVKVLGL